jgi:beta-phosphoglucomutase-like phosphatase (HAD superfamily)
MTKLKALIWDVDGTLAETEDEGHRIAFNLAFGEAGLSWHWTSTLYGELLAVAGGKERLLTWWQRVDPAGAAAPHAAETVHRLHERKTAHYLDMVRRGSISLRPGVARLLEAGRARGLRQAIATTTTMGNVTQLIEATLGPTGHAGFEVIGAGDIVPHKKPAPDIYLWVLQQLSLRAEECLAIEDSVIGVRAAQAAGVPVLLTRSRFTQSDAIAGVVADLGSLIDTGIDDLIDWHDVWHTRR